LEIGELRVNDDGGEGVEGGGGHEDVVARNLLLRPAHRERPERGSTPGSEGV